MSYWNTPLKIGTLNVPRFLGGPLDRITDEPFRKITRKFCTRSLLYTEIRHVAAIANMAIERCSFDGKVRPINFQMTASTNDYIDQACSRVVQLGVDAVDLNIGCPASHIIRSGAGSALMADIPRLTKILSCFRKQLTCPFTVKMRAGFKEQNASEIALLCQDCGVDAIVIHPRLQSQKFRGTPDYRVIANIKQQTTIPVIVSGGIGNLASAKLVYEMNGVDGFLIGRAQLGAPWLLRQLHDNSQGAEYQPSWPSMVQAIRDHMVYLEDYYGHKGLPLAKRHLGWYVRNKCHARLIRQNAHTCRTWHDIHELIRSIIEG